MNTATLVEMLITLPVGVVLLALGLLLWRKQRIQLMIGHHCRRVKAQDIPAYTRLWGIALVVLGACACLIGVLDTALRPGSGWVLFAAGAVVCFLFGSKAQKAYNGGWFS